MFSGIVEDVGTVRAVRAEGAGRRLVVATAIPVDPAAGVGAADRSRIGPGDSVAVDGACLTVEAVGAGAFEVVCGRETVERTTLGALRPGDRVHLERALRPTDRLDGHVVTGHVDAVGTVISAERQAESVVLWVRAPVEVGRLVAEKGSIAVAGVSLTVNEVRDGAGHVDFRTNIVPYTAEHTRLGALRPGERVNLEADVLARYVDRLLRGPGGGGGGLTPERMAALGYGGRRSGTP